MTSDEINQNWIDPPHTHKFSDGKCACPPGTHPGIDSVASNTGKELKPCFFCGMPVHMWGGSLRCKPCFYLASSEVHNNAWAHKRIAELEARLLKGDEYCLAWNQKVASLESHLAAEKEKNIGRKPNVDTKTSNIKYEPRYEAMRVEHKVVCVDCEKMLVALESRNEELLQKNQKLQEKLTYPNPDCQGSHFLLSEINALIDKIGQEKMLRVNEYANVERLIEWIADEKRKPATAAFTEGPERRVAYAVERLLLSARP